IRKSFWSLAPCTLAALTLLVALPSGARATDPAPAVAVEHGCLGWEPGSQFQRPLGIFFDTVKQECYVADTGNGQVIVCDTNGSPLYRFTHFVETDGHSVPGQPRSITVDGAGRIFLADDSSAELDVLDTTGRRITSIAAPGDHCGLKDGFELVALGPGGVYATLSCASRRVVVINNDLTIARVITLRWKDTADRACLTGLAVDAQGGIYVTDACASEMVQMYDPDGGLLRSFGTHETGLENFSFASGIALTNDGHMWIVDTLRHLVSFFTPEGTRITTVGGKGTEPGAMQYPSCVTTDGEGRVFVAERVGNRYQGFRLEGVPAGDHPAQSQLGMLLETVGND
ncbi:MAG TPA: NHL repeat-containing protein, partial [Candidatus Krumholzibacteria bacterium]|nr:NHL repeat-containing protein [Candidatus Krumholzibacteria bacterium]